MVLVKLDLNTANNNTVTQRQTQQPKQERVYEPAVEEKDCNKTDLEMPIEGYYIEKTSQNPDTQSEKVEDCDDDDVTAPPDPENNKIPVRESIAVMSDNIPDILKNAPSQLIDNAIHQNNFETNKNDQLLSLGIGMINRGQNSYFDLNLPKMNKKFGVNAEVIGETTKQEYTTETANISVTMNSVKGQIACVYNDVKKNFSTLFFFSGVKTTSKADMNFADVEGLESYNEADGNATNNTTSKVINIYGAAKKEYKKGSISFGGLYSDNESILTKNGRVGFSSYLEPWFTTISGYMNWSKVGNLSTIHESHLSVKFLQPKINEEEEKEEEQQESNNTDVIDTSINVQENTQNNNKKWTRSLVPRLDVHDEVGTITGVGMEFEANKNCNSKTKFATYAGVSTTSNSSEEEKQKYNGLLGVSFGYDKPLGSNTTFKAKMVVHDQITFPCKDNILTGAVKAELKTKKLSAYADARLTKVPESTYVAGTVGLVGTIKNSWEYFAQAYTSKLIDTDGKFKISSLELGARWYF